MLYQFERFLVVKIAERVQELSRHKCQACITGYSLDQLHLCMSIPLKEKIVLFLPRAKEDAISRVNNLFHLYQQTAWVDDEQVFIEGGTAFIKKITVDHLLDRRFVNEDTVMEYPYNTTWLAAEDDFLVTQIETTYVEPLPPILPLDLSDERPIKNSKKRKKDF